MIRGYFFEGFLQRFDVTNNEIEIRLSSGELNPQPLELPILYIQAQAPENIGILSEKLSAILLADDYVYVEEVATDEIFIHSILEAPTVIKARQLTTRHASFEACDFESLARVNYEISMQYHKAQLDAKSKINEALDLAQNQTQRLAAKCDFYEVGSIPHTLYAQQLLFLQRLIDMLKV